MNPKGFTSWFAGLALTLLCLTSAQAADKNPEMSEEMQAKMAKAKEAGTPGAEHAVLKPLEGEWATTSKMWMKPDDKKPQKSSGTSSMSWVLDGRFLKQKYKGDWQGQSFEGIGFLGYDKVKKEYVSVWMDSMATGMHRGAGQYDGATKTLKESGTFSCPVTGNPNMHYRSEFKIVDNDNLTYTMFMNDEAGKEFKGMEISYKRTK